MKRTVRRLISAVTLGISLALGGGVTPLQAQQDPLLNPAHPERHVVVRGDTLWDIAARFLADPWLWPEVWYVNPQIANPHLIYPGDVISLAYIDGRPRLVMERGGVRKLSPQVRRQTLEQAIPTIPMEVIRPFLLEAQVVASDAELEAAPYVVEVADEHLLAGGGDRLYVRHLQSATDTPLGVYERGQLYLDGVTGEVLGREAIFNAAARVQRAGDPGTAVITRVRQESAVGDRLLPLPDQDWKPFYVPRAPQGAIDGRIIGLPGGVDQVGRYQVVVVDRGAADGLEPGHVLAVHQAGKWIPDPVSADPNDRVRLPDEEAGLAMVFRSFERVSYALLLEATRPIQVADRVSAP